MAKKVVKRDGSIENYEEAKIVRVVTAAGLHPDQAQMVASTVSQRVSSIPGDTVSSLQIRDVLIEQLKLVNENAAGLFVWYEKTKDGQGVKKK